ncbi:MAG: hypothetical protein E7109_09765 [Bacteroidales bacterium]|jgi:hypothetical protein|nr:hypothetical protein [Bacteroidales bacterium]
MKNKKTIISIALGALMIILSLTSISLWADDVPYTECRNNPGLNNGHCMERAEGNGYACISSHWPRDCYKTTTVDDELQPGN